MRARLRVKQGKRGKYVAVQLCSPPGHAHTAGTATAAAAAVNKTLMGFLKLRCLSDRIVLRIRETVAATDVNILRSIYLELKPS